MSRDRTLPMLWRAILSPVNFAFPIAVLALLLVGCGRTDLESFGTETATGDGSEHSDGSATGWLAFQAETGGLAELRAVDISGHEAQRILSREKYYLYRGCGEAQWAPDGSAMVYLVDLEDDSANGVTEPQLFFVPFLDGESREAIQVKTEIPPPDEPFRDIHWGADSLSLGFEIDSDSDMSGSPYWTRISDGKPEPAQLVLDNTDHWFNEWSPDGYKIVFERGWAYTGEYDNELLFVDLAGGAPTEPSRLYPPFEKWGKIESWEWSPDGNWMVYDRRSDTSGYGLYAVQFENGTVRAPLRLNPEGLATGRLYFAPDSRRLLTSARASELEDSSLYFFNFDDPTAVAATLVPGAIPGGGELAYVYWLDTDRVICAIEVGAQTEYRVLNFRDTPVSVTALGVPDARSVSFWNTGASSVGLLHTICVSNCGADDPAAAEKWFWTELMSDEPERSLDVYTSEGDSVALSPDGQTLAVAGRTTVEDEGIREVLVLNVRQGTSGAAFRLGERESRPAFWSANARLKFSPDGKALAFVDLGTLYWLDLTETSPAKAHAVTRVGEFVDEFAWRP